MKNKLTIVFFSLSISLCAQSQKDSLLMKERSIDRPITLHRGQFRIEGGYGLSAITKRYDSEGGVIKLRDEGLSYVRHAWYVDLRCGIVNNLTLQLSSSYKRQSQRIEDVITTDAFSVTRLFEIQKKNGVEDLLIALSARAPFTSKSLDVVVTGGAYLPIGKDEDSRPEHKIIEDVGFRDITYHYNKTWGSATIIATMGGLIKYRTDNYAFTGSVMYNYPLSESEGINWQHQLIGNEFDYQSQGYTYQLQGSYNFLIEIERQLAPWFDLSIMVAGESTFGGWDELNGVKVTRSTSNLYTFNPGYEILVTPKVWLRQRIHVTLAGKDNEAPFSISTSLVYNFFAK
jgi:hypothetical protein